MGPRARVTHRLHLRNARRGGSNPRVAPGNTGHARSGTGAGTARGDVTGRGLGVASARVPGFGDGEHRRQSQPHGADQSTARDDPDTPGRSHSGSAASHRRDVRAGGRVWAPGPCDDRQDRRSGGRAGCRRQLVAGHAAAVEGGRAVFLRRASGTPEGNGGAS